MKPSSPALPIYIVCILFRSLTCYHTRQTNRPPDASRTKSLLRQRAHLPVMAQLYRDPGRAGGRFAELQRPNWSHLGGAIHHHRHGGHDLRLGYIPLARGQHPTPWTERVWWPVWSEYSGYCVVGGCGGEFCAEDKGGEFVIGLLFSFFPSVLPSFFPSFLPSFLPACLGYVWRLLIMIWSG